jgi:hypothetical protein
MDAANTIRMDSKLAQCISPGLYAIPAAGDRIDAGRYVLRGKNIGRTTKLKSLAYTGGTIGHRNALPRAG